MKNICYPSHATVKMENKKYISKRRFGYKVIDIICQSLVIGGTIGAMAGLVAYANYRDYQQFKRHNIVASFPSRPEECLPEDNCDSQIDEIVYGM